MECSDMQRRKISKIPQHVSSTMQNNMSWWHFEKEIGRKIIPYQIAKRNLYSVDVLCTRSQPPEWNIKGAIHNNKSDVTISMWQCLKKIWCTKNKYSPRCYLSVSSSSFLKHIVLWEKLCVTGIMREQVHWMNVVTMKFSLTSCNMAMTRPFLQEYIV